MNSLLTFLSDSLSGYLDSEQIGLVAVCVLFVFLLVFFKAFLRLFGGKK